MQQVVADYNVNYRFLSYKYYLNKWEYLSSVIGHQCLSVRLNVEMMTETFHWWWFSALAQINKLLSARYIWPECFIVTNHVYHSRKESVAAIKKDFRSWKSSRKCPWRIFSS